MATMTQKPKEAQVNGSSSPSVKQTADQMKEKAYKQFDDALNRMRAEVKQMQGKLQEYDDKFEASKTVNEQRQKATDFLNSSLEEIKASLDSLSKKAYTVFVEAKDFAADAVADLWKLFNEAVERYRKMVIEFDEKHHVAEKLTDMSKPFITKMKEVGGVFDHAKDSAIELGKSGRSYLINAAAAIDSRFSLESRFSDLDEKYKLSEKAKNLQQKGEDFIEKQKLKEKAMNLDERLTGSKAGEYINAGVGMVKEELGKIQQDFEAAKGVPKKTE